MFVVHMMTAFLTWKLPETKGLDLGEQPTMIDKDVPISGGGNISCAVRQETRKQNHSLGPYTGLIEMNQGSKHSTSYSELL